MILHIRIIFIRSETIPSYFLHLSRNAKLHTDSRDKFRGKAAIAEAFHRKVKLYGTVFINPVTVLSLKTESHA